MSHLENGLLPLLQNLFRERRHRLWLGILHVLVLDILGGIWVKVE